LTIDKLVIHRSYLVMRIEYIVLLEDFRSKLRNLLVKPFGSFDCAPTFATLLRRRLCRNQLRRASRAGRVQDRFHN